MAVIVHGVKSDRGLCSRKSILTLSFALSPILMFNQQVITGLSLQPVHYELFIGNYMVLTALVLTLWLIGRDSASSRRFNLSHVVIAFFAVGAIGWGVIESVQFTRRHLTGAKWREFAVQALHEVNASKPTGNCTVFSPSWRVNELTPVVTPCRPLWSLHSSSAGGLNRIEQKILFFEHAYLSEVNEEMLIKGLEWGDFVYVVPLFGFDKLLPELGTGNNHITKEEIEAAASSYTDFIAQFDAHTASDRLIDFAIIESDETEHMEGLDKLYQRDGGRSVGRFTVYRVSLRR